jgi:hypothetical protein
MKEVPVIVAKGWTDEQKNEFVIKDNVSSGEFDYDKLANAWHAYQLEEWGLDVWQFSEEVSETELEAEDFNTEKTSTTNLQYLKFSNYSIPITQNEIDGLSKIVNIYIDENSIPNGFVLKIIECFKK